METAGAFLKSNRVKKNRSIRDIAEATKISITSLEAIEGDRQEFLPPPSYVRGFLKLYAKELDLDPDEVVDLYERELLGKEKNDWQRELTRAQTASTAGKYLLCIAGAAAVAGCLFFFLASGKHDREAASGRSIPAMEGAQDVAVPAGEEVFTEAPPQLLPEQAEPPAPEVLPAPQPPAPARADNATAQAPAAVTEKDAGAFKVSFKALELTWLRIAADAKAPHEVMLRAGESYSETAETSLQVRIGNAGGVSVFFNGKPLGTPGETGKPVDLQFSGDGREAQGEGGR